MSSSEWPPSLLTFVQRMLRTIYYLRHPSKLYKDGKKFDCSVCGVTGKCVSKFSAHIRKQHGFLKSGLAVLSCICGQIWRQDCTEAVCLFVRHMFICLNCRTVSNYNRSVVKCLAECGSNAEKEGRLDEFKIIKPVVPRVRDRKRRPKPETVDVQSSTDSLASTTVENQSSHNVQKDVVIALEEIPSCSGVLQCDDATVSTSKGNSVLDDATGGNDAQLDLLQTSGSRTELLFHDTASSKISAPSTGRKRRLIPFPSATVLPSVIRRRRHDGKSRIRSCTGRSAVRRKVVSVNERGVFSFRAISPDENKETYIFDLWSPSHNGLVPPDEITPEDMLGPQTACLESPMCDNEQKEVDNLYSAEKDKYRELYDRFVLPEWLFAKPLPKWLLNAGCYEYDDSVWEHDDCGLHPLHLYLMYALRKSRSCSGSKETFDEQQIAEDELCVTAIKSDQQQQFFDDVRLLVYHEYLFAPGFCSMFRYIRDHTEDVWVLPNRCVCLDESKEVREISNGHTHLLIVFRNNEAYQCWSKHCSMHNLSNKRQLHICDRLHCDVDDCPPTECVSVEAARNWTTSRAGRTTSSNGSLLNRLKIKRSKAITADDFFDVVNYVSRRKFIPESSPIVEMRQFLLKEFTFDELSCIVAGGEVDETVQATIDSYLLQFYTMHNRPRFVNLFKKFHIEITGNNGTLPNGASLVHRDLIHDVLLYVARMILNGKTNRIDELVRESGDHSSRNSHILLARPVCQYFRVYCLWSCPFVLSERLWCLPFSYNLFEKCIAQSRPHKDYGRNTRCMMGVPLYTVFRELHLYGPPHFLRWSKSMRVDDIRAIYEIWRKLGACIPSSAFDSGSSFDTIAELYSMVVQTPIWIQRGRAFVTFSSRLRVVDKSDRVASLMDEKDKRICALEEENCSLSSRVRELEQALIKKE